MTWLIITSFIYLLGKADLSDHGETIGIYPPSMIAFPAHRTSEGFLHCDGELEEWTDDGLHAYISHSHASCMVKVGEAQMVDAGTMLYYATFERFSRHSAISSLLV